MTNKTFSVMLSEDGKKNSLGLSPKVVELVLEDRSRLEELYETIFHEDAWVRMRAIDAFEKVCRVNADWIEPYIGRIQMDLSLSKQASIQWHMAQIYAQVHLDQLQKQKAISWLTSLLSSVDVDWIVSANCMTTLAYFAKNDEISKSDLIALLKVQSGHKSNTVVKRAAKFLSEFS